MSSTDFRTRWQSAVSLVCVAAIASGCAVNEDDLQRWETTLEGPKRLSAVVLYDKYPHDLRVKSAIALIRMKPRKGQRVGIERLVLGTLTCDSAYLERRKNEPCNRTTLSPESRSKIVADLIARIIAELEKEPPKATQGTKAPADPSYTYKDAAYMMLTHTTQIVADQVLKDRLLKALTAWAMADFERRLNDRAQDFGMEQLLRYIGSESVEGLPELMNKGSRNLSKMSTLISKLGSKETKEKASKRLVKIITYIASAQWAKDKAPELKAANTKAGFTVEGKQFDKQLQDYQNETMVRIYSSMKKVGGKAVVKYCLSVALDEKRKTKLRQTALAALEGHIDTNDDKSIAKLFKLAKAEKTPPVLIDMALRRIKEMPRKKVVGQLYSFLEGDKWPIRRLAGATILAMSKVEHIDEFMKNLAAKATKNFALPEARTYAAYLADLKEGKPLDKLKKHMGKGTAQTRLTAIAYYLAKGTKKDLDAVKPYEEDKQKVPTCDEDADCSYKCVVGEGKKRKEHEIKTVGEFVTYCVKPRLLRKKPEDNEKGKGDKGKKPAPKEKKDQKGDKKDE